MCSTVFVSLQYHPIKNSNYHFNILYSIVERTTRNYPFSSSLSLCASNFLEERLQYLRPLMETLVEFMKNVSHVYYQCSLAIVKLLPPDILNEESYTKFESNSFETSGEIDYQSLKVNINMSQ